MSILHQDCTENEYLITTDKQKIDIQAVHQFLSNESYWAQNIPFATVSTSIEHSICIAIIHQETLVGFGRMITDNATFAYLADIFVIEAYRGKGLSKLLMRHFLAIMDELELRRTILTTQDAHSLYAQFDFVPFPWPERLMYYTQGKTYKPNN